ncbi:hypothetical protein [Oceaniglobus ichthyenteri]|uniref:hypothetical protein n=1 Tax=Oceaniglobus ichthyenteri TaxID=2136177 RepID=UPI000F83C8AE
MDNAAYEDFFGRLKTEFFYPLDWRTFTAAQFSDEISACTADITKYASRCPWVSEAQLNTVKPLPYAVKTVQVFIRTPINNIETRKRDPHFISVF